MPLQREHANCPKSLRGTGSKAEQEVHHRIPAQSVPSSPSAPSPCVLPGAESLADPSLYPRNHLCQAPVDHTPKLFMSWAEGQAQGLSCSLSSQTLKTKSPLLMSCSRPCCSWLHSLTLSSVHPARSRGWCRSHPCRDGIRGW